MFNVIIKVFCIIKVLQGLFWKEQHECYQSSILATAGQPEACNFTVRPPTSKMCWSCWQVTLVLAMLSWMAFNCEWILGQPRFYFKQGKSEGFDSCNRLSNLTQIGFKSSIFQLVWPWNLMDDPENNRAPLLYHIKLCASFQIHQWIQTGVTVWKHSVRVKIDNYFTLKFDRWTWKTKGHLFNATLSFVHNFVAIGEYKLELQSGNSQFGSKSMIFSALWPWNLTDDLEKQ